MSTVVPVAPGVAVPRGVWVTAAYFAVAGLLEIGAALAELPRPLAFWPVWEAVGRGVFHLVLALGLWHRMSLCRSVAMVYCLAVLVMYAVVFVLAFSHAPVRFPSSLVVKSLIEIPSCALLLPYLAWIAFATLLNWQFLALNPQADGAAPSNAVQRIEL